MHFVIWPCFFQCPLLHATVTVVWRCQFGRLDTPLNLCGRVWNQNPPKICLTDENAFRPAAFINVSVHFLPRVLRHTWQLYFLVSSIAKFSQHTVPPVLCRQSRTRGSTLQHELNNARGWSHVQTLNWYSWALTISPRHSLYNFSKASYRGLTKQNAHSFLERENKSWHSCCPTRECCSPRRPSGSHSTSC